MDATRSRSASVLHADATGYPVLSVLASMRLAAMKSKVPQGRGAKAEALGWEFVDHISTTSVRSVCGRAFHARSDRFRIDAGKGVKDRLFGLERRITSTFCASAKSALETVAIAIICKERNFSVSDFSSFHARSGAP